MGRAAKPVRNAPIDDDGPASQRPRDTGRTPRGERAARTTQDDDARSPRDQDAVLTPQDRAFLDAPPGDVDGDGDDSDTNASDEAGLAPAAPPGDLFDRVGRFLLMKGFPHEALPGREFHAVRYDVAHTSLRVILESNDEGERSCVLALAMLPVRVPERRRTAVAEALCRINFVTGNGVFEMDFRDGEIRVRTFADLGAGYADAIVDRALGSAIGGADKYFAALMAVAYGNADPAQVLELAQRGEGRGLQ